MAHTVYCRPGSDRFLVEPLPDGSAAVFDSASESVHSLNQTAAVVWECCGEPVALTDIVEVVRRVTGLSEPRGVAEEALNQLERAGLVETRRMDDDPPPSRRTALRIRAVARGSSIAFLAPLVLTMTVGEQHAFAQQTGSPVTTTTSAPTTTSTTTTQSPTTTSATTTSTTTTQSPTTTSATTTSTTTTQSPTTTSATTTSTTTTQSPTTTSATTTSTTTTQSPTTTPVPA